MAGRASLIEQKRIQWAKEREEMARLNGSWGLLKQNNNIRTNIRTYPAAVRMSLAEMKDKQAPSKPFRAAGHYGSNVSLKSLATENSNGNGTTSIKCLDYNGGSLINLNDQPEVSQIRRRSPSLPPIYSKDQQYFCQDRDQQRDFGVEGLRYQKQQRQHDLHRSYERFEDHRKSRYGCQGEEREGETSGYASDSVEVPVAAAGTLLPGCKPPGIDMSEKTWQNPYYATPESSLPPSRRLSDGRIGELNRPRWGSVWGHETARGDPPPPSWLARLGHSSQVLVINHDSATSSDSSTTGSTGSETNKTYLRGQNIPVDAAILQEREARRQKAVELQNAIKLQLEEKDRQRKEERERKLREERLEEERIKREREKERERYEEEQRRLKEKEAVKLKQAETMREVLQAAERLANEEKKNRRKRDENVDESIINSPQSCDSKFSSDDPADENSSITRNKETPCINNDNVISPDEIVDKKEDNNKESLDVPEKLERHTNDRNSVQVPISKDVAIVLSGTLEDSEILNKANLQLVNLVLTPSPRKFENSSNNLPIGLNAFMQNMASPHFVRRSMIVENRLLTPSKYRILNGRDFGTQTDIENDLQDHREQMQESTVKDTSVKERKDTTNASRRDNEKSTNTGPVEDMTMKALPRSKSQPRTSIDSRPRWNANRPGTRYRTQSEKDPHYQRRLRLRRRQVESSDERSRSPSPDRRKLINIKSKTRTINRRKIKLDSYDADLSMDSLNSIIPLRTDKNGRINVEDSKCERKDKVRSDNDRVNDIDRTKKLESENSSAWCGQEILSKLSSLRNGLLLKQIEWDSERRLVSPAPSEIY